MNTLNVIFDPSPVSYSLGGLRKWGKTVKIHLCQNTVMLHIKLKGIVNVVT